MQSAIFIAFTSPCGGVGTSTLALIAGRTLSRLYDKKVLYISFDALSSKCGPAGGADRADFFRAVIGAAGEVANKTFDRIVDEAAVSPWNALKRSGLLSDEYGLCYLKCKEHQNPLHYGYADYEALLLELSKDYDYVLLDLPFCLLKALKLFSCCEHIVLCYGFAANSLYRHYEAAAGFLSELCAGSQLHKFVCDRYEEDFAEGEADIHGEFGARVRSLLGEIDAGV